MITSQRKSLYLIGDDLDLSTNKNKLSDLTALAPSLTAKKVVAVSSDTKSKMKETVIDIIDPRLIQLSKDIDKDFDKKLNQLAV